MLGYACWSKHGEHISAHGGDRRENVVNITHDGDMISVIDELMQDSRHIEDV